MEFIPCPARLIIRILNLYTIIRPMKTFLPFRAPPPGMLVLALTIFASSAPAQAQLRLPGLNLPLPQRLGPLDLQVVRDPAERLLAATPLPELGKLRLREVDSLLQRHGNLLEQDPRGEPAVRSEILAWSPSAAGREAALAAGLTIIRERQLDGLDEIMVVFAVPAALRTADVLARLRILDPEGSYDFNHVYTGSSAAPLAVRAPATSGSGPVRSPGRLPAVGLVDSGVDQAHPVFADATVTPWGCDGARHPHHHGTAVAGLMVGMSAHFRGVRPGASLFAADVYCNSGTGGSADKIAAALAWLAREQVGVINLSIVGPANQTLEKVVAAMVRRGHLLVAAQ